MKPSVASWGVLSQGIRSISRARLSEIEENYIFTAAIFVNLPRTNQAIKPSKLSIGARVYREAFRAHARSLSDGHDILTYHALLDIYLYCKMDIVWASQTSFVKEPAANQSSEIKPNPLRVQQVACFCLPALSQVRFATGVRKGSS